MESKSKSRSKSKSKSPIKGFAVEAIDDREVVVPEYYGKPYFEEPSYGFQTYYMYRRPRNELRSGKVASYQYNPRYANVAEKVDYDTGLPNAHEIVNAGRVYPLYEHDDYLNYANDIRYGPIEIPTYEATSAKGPELFRDISRASTKKRLHLAAQREKKKTLKAKPKKGGKRSKKVKKTSKQRRK